LIGIIAVGLEPIFAQPACSAIVLSTNAAKSSARDDLIRWRIAVLNPEAFPNPVRDDRGTARPDK
jgi:hypothetical protein